MMMSFGEMIVTLSMVAAFFAAFITLGVLLWQGYQAFRRWSANLFGPDDDPFYEGEGFDSNGMGE